MLDGNIRHRNVFIQSQIEISETTERLTTRFWKTGLC
jgi:hypothetical protein